VGPSKTGKSFWVSQLAWRAREAAVQAQEQADPVSVANHVDSVPEEVKWLDATQAPLSLYVSLRQMPRHVDTLGSFLLGHFGVPEKAASRYRISDLHIKFRDVLRVLNARTGHLPFVVIDDAQRIFEGDPQDPVRKAMEDFVILLHDLAHLDQSLRLVLIMSSDETESLCQLSGMRARLNIFRSGYIDLRPHTQALQDKLGLSASDVESIIETLGGNLGDLDKVVKERSVGIPVALERVVNESASSMTQFLKGDPSPQLAWKLLQQLCTDGMVDMAAVAEHDGVDPDPEPVIRRLAVANLARKQGVDLYFPYKPVQAKAWPLVEGNGGVRSRAVRVWRKALFVLFKYLGLRRN